MMRFIKVFLVGLVGLFCIVTILSLFIPSNVRVSRAVVINADQAKIFAQVANFNHWKNWHPMFKSSEAVITCSSPSANAFCDISYRNRKMHLQVTALDSTSIKFLLQSEGENDINNEINLIHVKEQNAIQVEWKAQTKLHWYPWEKFYGIFIDKISGPGYEDALNSLKDFTEAN